mgnify:CR=1 FL=1
MITIKKYSNRRLYDTDRSSYITLEDLAERICKGDDVRVVDASTGRDLTQATLVQIVLESRGAARFLPAPLLVAMIRMGDDALAEFLGRYMSWALQVYSGVRSQARTMMGAFGPGSFMNGGPFTGFMGGTPWQGGAGGHGGAGWGQGPQGWSPHGAGAQGGQGWAAQGQPMPWGAPGWPLPPQPEPPRSEASWSPPSASDVPPPEPVSAAQAASSTPGSSTAGSSTAGSSTPGSSTPASSPEATAPDPARSELAALRRELDELRDSLKAGARSKK